MSNTPGKTSDSTPGIPPGNNTAQPPAVVFDQPASLAINLARRVVLDDLLQTLDPQRQWRTALDAGCGVGYFSRHLADHGYKVVGIDGRSENIALAHYRHPDIAFHTHDIEDSKVCGLDAFDLVLCFGLLYHLENPFAAVRNLASLTARALLIETMIAPGDDALAVLLDEFRGQDQGLRQLALIPTQTCLVKMLHRAGFAHVYQASQLPDHPDYRASGAEYQKRNVLVALRNTCNTVKLLPCADHRIRWDACWKKA